jgi:hypothetical protein
VQLYTIFKHLTLNVVSRKKVERNKRKNKPKERRSFGHKRERERERTQWAHFEAVLPSVTEN